MTGWYVWCKKQGPVEVPQAEHDAVRSYLLSRRLWLNTDSLFYHLVVYVRDKVRTSKLNTAMGVYHVHQENLDKFVKKYETTDHACEQFTKQLLNNIISDGKPPKHH